MKSLSNIAKKILGGAQGDWQGSPMQSLRTRWDPQTSGLFPPQPKAQSYSSPAADAGMLAPALRTRSVRDWAQTHGVPTSTNSEVSLDNAYLIGIIIILVLALTALCIWFFILKEDDEYVVDNKKERKAKRIK